MLNNCKKLLQHNGLALDYKLWKTYFDNGGWIVDCGWWTVESGKWNEDQRLRTEECWLLAINYHLKPL